MSLDHPAADAVATPRLTIAIPTYNRVHFLDDLLRTLAAQLADLPSGAVELIVSDNCSTDATAALVAGHQTAGLPLRYACNESNLGPDGNILRCFELAQGEYVWILGDDDLIVPGTLRDLLSLLDQCPCDLVYLSSFGFTGDYVPGETDRGRTGDALGRYAEVVTDARYFLTRVNALVGLISGNITNKRRLMALGHPPLDALLGSFLVQLGWQFPLLAAPGNELTILYVWHKLVAYRTFNSEGWGAARVFGLTLDDIAARYFTSTTPTAPRLRSTLMNAVLRYWMVDVIVSMRRGQHTALEQESFARVMGERYHGNWRYWVFVYPLAELPLPAARALHKAFSLINKATRFSAILLRHRFRHGRYFSPKP